MNQDPLQLPLTIFSMPKPFRGHIDVIQRNAIGSWLRLKPRPEIILFGNEQGVAEIAAAKNLIHEPNVNHNQYGTPLIDEMFLRAQKRASHEILAYINSDIILFNDFCRAIERVINGYKQFLIIGRRIDVNIDALLDFSSNDWEKGLSKKVDDVGSLASRLCKDYFVFCKPLFLTIPPFAVGRAVYDNWLVYHAKQQNMPVIDATRVIRAVHQNHDYGHVSGGTRYKAYNNEESKQNCAIAGGKRLVTGSTPSLVLTPATIRRPLIPGDWLQFFADLPRFLCLLLDVIGWKRRRYQDANNN